MSLQGSGQISLADIGAEFGDTKPYSMSKYYRGGALVPDVPTNNNIPSSGTISLGGFYNATRQWTTSWSTAWNTSVTTSQSTTTSWSTSWTTSGVITEGPFWIASNTGWVWGPIYGPIDKSGIYWNGSFIAAVSVDTTTTYTINGYTYTKGNQAQYTPPYYPYLPVPSYGWYVSRSYSASATTSATTSQNTSTAWSTAWSTSQTTSKLTP